jgi:predicted dinucleotide-binding enzyme
MKIAIIGSGNVGGALARCFLKMIGAFSDLCRPKF